MELSLTHKVVIGALIVVMVAVGGNYFLPDKSVYQAGISTLTPSKPPIPPIVNATDILKRAVELSKAELARHARNPLELHLSLPHINGLAYLTQLALVGAARAIHTVFFVVAPRDVGKTTGISLVKNEWQSSPYYMVIEVDFELYPADILTFLMVTA